MKKFLYILIIPLIISGCSFGSSLPIINIDDKNKNFDFSVDQKFQIVLPANHTTGYQWIIKDVTDGALEHIDNDYRLSDEHEGEIVGAGGEESLTFKVLEVMRSHIVLQYARSWDESDVANNFLVTINGNPGDDGLLTYYGILYDTPYGSQYKEFFRVSDTKEEFGIEPLMINQIPDPGVRSKMEEYKAKEWIIEIRGKMTEGAPAYGGKQFIIHEIAPVGA